MHYSKEAEAAALAACGYYNMPKQDVSRSLQSPKVQEHREVKKRNTVCCVSVLCVNINNMLTNMHGESCNRFKLVMTHGAACSSASHIQIRVRQLADDDDSLMSWQTSLSQRVCLPPWGWRCYYILLQLSLLVRNSSSTLRSSMYKS
jgi:hypothetical protein